MASISTDDAAPTSHVDAPVPVATRDHEEGAGVVGKGTASAEQAAARRDVFLLAGIRKLIKSFRSLTHIFEMYEDGDEEEDDDDHIQIGFPTDVEHVAHIGLDGSSSVASLRGMDGARELLSLSTNISLHQFEFAMASIAAHDDRSSAAITASP
ncbi:hypothetical protein ZWY2020_027552 [Hordeum vulgare]|nr:hypothetical protein ZWY2020_027552 [Hordeum vulgare]